MVKILLVLILLIVNSYAIEKLKVGVLAFGTVNWELDTLKHNKLDIKNGFELEIVKLASKNATSIALQAGTVDIIVTDWIWVNTQRGKGADFTLYPYSKANGTLYVGENSKAKTLIDLKGKDIGVAGGPFDKTWLIFRAYSKLKTGKDFKDIVNPTFASPPILFKKVIDGSLDGAVNFWHFNAKAKAKGARAFVEIKDVLEELGIKEDISFIGWTFRRDKALKNPNLYNGFIKASHEAKDILLADDNAWERVKPLMKAKDEKTFLELKSGYKNGVIKEFSERNIKDSQKLFKILVDIGGKKLVKNSDTFDKNTFWNIDKN